MTENMKKLLEIVSGNKELATKVGGMGQEEIIALGKELSIALTEADFVKTCELSDDELDTVVDGGKCICSFGGGGKAGESEKTCACVMGGGGEYSDGSVRCVCIIGGGGNW